MSKLNPVSSLSERITFLKKVVIFAALSDEKLATLADDLHLRRYRKNEVIFHQGDSSHDLYLVRQGLVRIFKTSPAGAETSINIFSRYDVVGEFATLDDQPRSATAKAITACHLYQFPQSQFLQRMEQMPKLALGVTRLLVTKIRWTAAYAETVAQYDAPGRLLHILLLYNEQFGRVIEAGKQYELDLGLNQTDLASLVGARREWVNRLLGRWRDLGLVELRGRKIVILDLPRAEQERDGHIEAFSQ